MYPNCPVYVPILLGLAAFGVVYNHWVEALEKKGHDRGYMSLIVSAGCAVTLAGASFIIGLGPVLWALICFAASGIPMIIGSISRYCRARTQQRQQCLDHDSNQIQR